MRVALVPMGYGDGIPRHASNRPPRCWSTGCAAGCSAGSAWTSSWSAPPTTHAGDEVVLFGPGSHGEPTATDWARWCGTIDYEIVTRMGGRQTRVWVGDEERRSEHVGAPWRTPPVVSARPRSPPSRPVSWSSDGWCRARRAGAAAGRPARRTPLRPGRRDLRRRGGAARRGRRGGAVRRLEDRSSPQAARRRDARLRARLRPQPRLLALPARGVPRQAPDGVLRPALARSLRSGPTASTRPSTSSATTSRA